LLVDLNQPERAVAVLDEGLRLDPKDEILLNQSSYAQMAAGNLAGALQANDKYMVLRPNDPNPWDTRGDVLYWFGRDEEAVSAYRKVLEIKPDFAGHLEYLKIAVVYADQKKFALAETALQEYGQRAAGPAKLYLPVYEAQFRQLRGDLVSARQSYQGAVKALGRAGQNEGAGNALTGLATISLLTGEGISADLTFARQQKLAGDELPALALLEAVQGDSQAAERSLQQYAATHSSWGGLHTPELMGADNRAYAALARNEGQAALAATSALPDLQDPPFLFAKGRAYGLVKDYPRAQQQLLRVLSRERDLSSFDAVRSRMPLLEALAHFYLAQAYEATGKRDQAVNEYQDFLSHFENPHPTFPQVTEARAALKHLM
jgi:tetratricopeptide (TPR) repeat protein